MIEIEEKRFLELLKASIHNRKANEKLFEGINTKDWNIINKLASQQTVQGLIFDRALLLSKEYLPDKMQLVNMAVTIEMIEKRNKKIEQTLKKLKDFYNENGFDFVVLKGQTLAKFYPNPKLRVSGDLDLYLYRNGDYDKVNEFLSQKGYKLEGDSLYEKLYYYEDVAIENHKYIALFGIKKYDDFLNSILKDIRNNNEFLDIDIDENTYKTLPLELNAVYIFQHILHHFRYLGIGFRQILDWYIFLEANIQNIDKAKFGYIANKFDLIRPMKYFALLGIKYLDIKESIFPFEIDLNKPKDDKLVDIILEDILQGGNFGMEHFANKKFRNIWQRRFYMFRKTTMRSIKLSRISPEHIATVSFVSIMNRIRIATLKLLGNHS